MKKWIRAVFLSISATALMCGTAFAAEASVSGVYDAAEEAGYTLTPQTADKSSITPQNAEINGAAKSLYADAVRFELTGTGTDGTQYAVFVLGDNGSVPTKSNIAYMDQDTASNGTISFNLYPGSLSSGTYNVYLAAGGGDGLQKVAAFSYYQAYTLGDVDADGKINASDALVALQKSVELIELSDTQMMAADVTKDGKINSSDALKILQYSVQLIDTFD